MRRLIILLFLGFLSFSILGQDNKPKRLKVFIDCTSTWCDMTYIRTEINVVDFLLDRVASDVHVLVTSLRNGGGGRQYQFIFYGQNQFKTHKDTLQMVADPNATDFEIRQGMVNYIKMGLAPLVAKTQQANKVSITMKSEVHADSLPAPPVKDKWNYWVFRIGANGDVSMDKVYKSSSLRGNFRINRVTDKHKLSMRFFGGRDRSSYEYNTDTGPLKVVVKNKNYGLEHFYVKSINNHWSYGYSMLMINNTFNNYRSNITFLPQIEYSFFPYKDVNTRFITLRYGAGSVINHYYSTTLYLKDKEILWGHNAELNVSYNQKWGTINTGIRYRNYFHNWKINNLGLVAQVDVRITGGLSVYVYAYGGLVHDQIYLPLEGATTEEVLSRQRQLQSSYNFQSYFGINYRFGTKLNNFINPRFNSAFD